MAEGRTKICRICLLQIMKDEPYHFLNNETDLILQSKLLDFVPELDLNITQNPISCSQCTRTINEIHQFKQLCVRTENIIKHLSLQELSLGDALYIFKKEQLDESIKEEFVENPIKNETVEDQCVQINMDIPVCIEESTSIKVSYYCYNCNYCTDKKDNLITHVLTHQNEISTPQNFNKKPLKIEVHQCNICDYRSKYVSNLNRHSRTHTGEKPFCCNMCSYRCNDTSSLKTHLFTHTGEKPFCCKICGYSSYKIGNLKQHLRTHTKEKPFCCSICNYRCNVMATLKQHLRKHTGEKPFSCNICNYRCNQTANLKRHLHTHTIEKPICCNTCSYRCKDKSNLRQHLRTHTGEKPYRCNICDYGTVRMSLLKKHLHRHES